MPSNIRFQHLSEVPDDDDDVTLQLQPLPKVYSGDKGAIDGPGRMGDSP